MSDETKIKSNGYLFVLWGLLMHLVVLWGVLDANFHSPILQGLPVTPPPTGPPAKRLFIFVSDGLRFRTFMEDLPPFLRHVMNEKGVWGVSHTRMPTESRPGHVALAAGLYEDPSALFKGWKENPVDFDSVLNRSSISWAWGSPDIVHMFAKSSANVHAESYPHEWQDFDTSSKSAIHLDSWVFKRFYKWLKTDAATMKNQGGVVILLNLLGCDTSGHASKPYSREYKENMRYDDQEIARLVKETEEYFGDDSTAYIFTSDHGMTDWGSHGSGSTDETETPVVVWGAGIGRTNVRQDIEQADIAPLIASVLGLSIPVNNEGVLPRGYLKSGNDTYGAYAFRSNVAQLSVQVKANRVVCSGDDPSDAHWREKELDKKIRRIDSLLENGEVTEAIEECERAVLLSKESLSFYRGYQRNRFIFYLTLTWLGWITLLFMKLATSKQSRMSSNQAETQTYRLRVANLLFILATVVIVVENKLSGRPGWRVPGYGIVASVSMWLASRSTIQLSPAFAMKRDVWISPSLVGPVLLVASMSAGMIIRFFFTVGVVIIAIMQKILIRDSTPRLWWSAIALAIFPSLPVVGPNPRTYIVLTSLVIAAIGLTTFRSLNKYLKFMELARLAVTVMVVTGIIDGRYFVAWIILATTPICVCFHPANAIERIAGVAYGLFCPYALLSASYEPLFYLIFAAHLLAWPQTRSTIEKLQDKQLTPNDVIQAAFFMLYTLLCFFGTGNIASISSFDPTWTRHFITVFSPFTMSALILLKFGIPLILVGCASRVFASSSVFLAVLLLGDCLSLPLMYGITTQGSWLDIGTAISRYTIAITLPCLLLVLHHLSRPLMTFSMPLMYRNTPDKIHLV